MSDSATTTTTPTKPTYQSGFDNTFETECVDGALPTGRNNPRPPPFQLYAEQLSGTAFTRPRHVNRRVWLYRQQPSAVHNPQPFVNTNTFFGGADPTLGTFDPNPMRWSPFQDTPSSCRQEDSDDGTESKDTKKDFITGMHLLMSAGDPPTKNGLAIYVYMFNDNMDDSYMYNSDGDFLIVPQEGALLVKTELGVLHVEPKEIVVIPRGIVFSIHKLDSSAQSGDKDVNNEKVKDPTSTSSSRTYRGYVLEVYKGHFTLPELGPIGSNGLANARDFLYPTAWCESLWISEEESQGCDHDQKTHRQRKLLYNKFGSKLWSKHIDSSPFDVVAWQGNYSPFKYDLSLFCAVNSVTYDHLDPSIYTVLTCVGDETGTALTDFVIFPPRWIAVDSNTFRPPWFHRNTMTEFMGNIYGSYDAKKGFLPGGASLHPCMTPHGPDTISYANAMADPCDGPTYYDSLSFMFETSCMMRLTDYALDCAARESDYGSCWKGLSNDFQSNKKHH